MGIIFTPEIMRAPDYSKSRDTPTRVDNTHGTALSCRQKGNSQSSTQNRAFETVFNAEMGRHVAERYKKINLRVTHTGTKEHL